MADYPLIGALKQFSNASDRRFGGLAHLMAGLNGLLVGLVVLLQFLPIAASAKAEITSSERLHPSIGAITVALVAHAATLQEALGVSAS